MCRCKCVAVWAWTRIKFLDLSPNLVCTCFLSGACTLATLPALISCGGCSDELVELSVAVIGMLLYGVVVG